MADDDVELIVAPMHPGESVHLIAVTISPAGRIDRKLPRLDKIDLLYVPLRFTFATKERVRLIYKNARTTETHVLAGMQQ
jgi:hypothetical protein